MGFLGEKEKEQEFFSDIGTWAASLSTKWAGKSLKYHSEIDSTNIAAVRESHEGAVHGTLIVADKQTSGRGRRGRIWESPAGKNLYFSLLLRPEFPAEQASMLTLVMAHSVAGAIEETAHECRKRRSNVINLPNNSNRVGRVHTQNCESGVRCTKESEPLCACIKWPNDILIHGKKVCGILTELKVDKGRMQYIVIGVGINVKPQVFEGELAEKASTLEQEWGLKISREQLLRNIMNAFERDYEAFVWEGNLRPLLEEYDSRLLNKDAQVRVLDPKGSFEGIARGITERGELIVETMDGSICHVYAGEVSVRGLQGYV